MRKRVIYVAIISILLLTGCTSTAPNEALSKALGDMYGEEEGYRKHQEQLNDLEKKEQQLFEDTIELDREQQEEINQNIEALQTFLAQRQDQIEDEDAAMKKARKHVKAFEKAASNVPKEQQSSVETLQDVIGDRYEAHHKLVEEYQSLLQLQERLYTLLADEKADASNVEEQVQAVNEQNEVVMKAVEAFNTLTVSLNEQKETVFQHLQQQE